MQTFLKPQVPMRILGPPFHCLILPENRSSCFAFHILHPPLISGTKGFQTRSVWIWLVGFTETCSGHSLSIIIISQLPLDNGKKNLKSNSRPLLGWLESYFASLTANTRAQQPSQTGGGVASEARVPRHKSRSLLCLCDLDKCYVELCPPIIHTFKS